MNKQKRPGNRLAFLLFFIAASLLLAACGARGINTNWPGLSTDGKAVYISYGPAVLAYDVKTQEQLWSFPPEPSAGLSFYAAPSIADGRIIIGDYGSSGSFSPQVNVSVYALDVTQGSKPEELWRKERLSEGSVIAPPLQIGDNVYVGTDDNFVYALSAKDGTPLWPKPFRANHGVWGQPAFKDGVLFVNSLDKTVYAVDTKTGQEMWHKQLNGALSSSPVVNLDQVYVAGFDHKVHAFDIDTGEEKWAVTGEDWIWSAPAYSDGVVYFADAKGNVFAVNGEDGRQIWTRPLIQAVQSSPVVMDDIVYVGSGGTTESETGTLTALSVENGEILWQKDTPAPIYTTPVIVGDLIIVAMAGGRDLPMLMAFDRQTGASEWEIAPPESG